ncbi:hypothetical protein AXK58_20160 [Tsukamurella tyrosinosolvens]|nr:hypothetical protein AXK58_20160 [Tsukamurella tyrosinosolvens]
MVWRARWHGKEKEFPTEAEAREYENNRKGKRQATVGPRVDTWTVRRAVEEHMEAAEEGSSTRAGRKQLLDNLGALEYLRMDRVTREHVEEWIEELTTGRPWKGDKPLAVSTVRTLRRILASLFNAAIEDGHLERNPCRLRRDKKGRTVARAISPSEIPTKIQVRELIESTTDPQLALMFRVAATTGIRIAELTGLRVRSVDVDGRRLHVEAQSRLGGAEWAWSSLKTPNAIRTVPLTDALALALKDHIDKLDRDLDAPLFLTQTGRQFSPTNAGNRLRSLGAPITKWHSLRHFYASTLFDQGRTAVAVSKLLGHASLAVTMETYLHIIPGEDDATRAALADL